MGRQEPFSLVTNNKKQKNKKKGLKSPRIENREARSHSLMIKTTFGLKPRKKFLSSKKTRKDVIKSSQLLERSDPKTFLQNSEGQNKSRLVHAGSLNKAPQVFPSSYTDHTKVPVKVNEILKGRPKVNRFGTIQPKKRQENFKKGRKVNFFGFHEEVGQVATKIEKRITSKILRLRDFSGRPPDSALTPIKLKIQKERNSRPNKVPNNQLRSKTKSLFKKKLSPGGFHLKQSGGKLPSKSKGNHSKRLRNQSFQKIRRKELFSPSKESAYLPIYKANELPREEPENAEKLKASRKRGLGLLQNQAIGSTNRVNSPCGFQSLRMSKFTSTRNRLFSKKNQKYRTLF